MLRLFPLLPVLGRCLLHFNSINPLFRLCDLHEGKPFKQSENLLILIYWYHTIVIYQLLSLPFGISLGRGRVLVSCGKTAPSEITLLVLLYFEFYVLLRILNKNQKL